jgi:hypothetical protein
VFGDAVHCSVSLVLVLGFFVLAGLLVTCFVEACSADLTEDRGNNVQVITLLPFLSKC